MNRLFTALLFAFLASPATAQLVDRTALLEEAQAFGTLVGQAAQCAVPSDTIQAYVSKAIPTRLPATGDAAFDEQLNQAFEQAMRGATVPETGCEKVTAAIS